MYDLLYGAIVGDFEWPLITI